MIRLLLTISISFFIYTLNAQIQNPNWFVPPYLINFTESSLNISELECFNGEYPETTNSVFGQTGNLIFYTYQDIIFDKNCQEIGRLYTFPHSEINIIRDIEQCNLYYIIYSIDGSFASPSKLYLTKVQVTNQTPEVIGGHLLLGEGEDGSEKSYCAITPLFENFRFIYYGKAEYIKRYKFDESGINFEATIYEGDFNVFDSNNQSELELSSDGSKIAIWSDNREIKILSLNENGDIASELTYDIPTNYINGLEFVKFGNIDRLYFAGSDGNSSLSGIYYIDLNIGTSNEAQLISNTTAISQGNLELGFDKNLYSLANNTLTQITFPEHSISTIATNTGAFRSLPDQIDGESYFKSDFDLIIRDNANDQGFEPNPATESIWEGNIWNCQNSPDCLLDEHPMRKSTPNFLRVKIDNLGCQTSPQAELKLYWTIARTDELWDDHWVENNSNEINGYTAGGELTSTGSLIIPEIPAGGSVVLDKEWYPPNPDWFQAGSDPMICYLGRIIAPFDQMYNEQQGPIAYNIRNNNNIATRNSTLIKIHPLQKSRTLSFTLSNISGDFEYQDLEIVRIGNTNQQNTDINISLDEEILKQISSEQVVVKGANTDRKGNLVMERDANSIILKNIFVSKDSLFDIGIQFQNNISDNNLGAVTERYVLKSQLNNNIEGAHYIIDVEYITGDNDYYCWGICLVILTILSLLFFFVKKIRTKKS